MDPDVADAEFASSLNVFLSSAMGDSGIEMRDGGVFATRDLPDGVCIRVPQKFVLDAHAARRTRLGASLGAAFTAEETLLFVLACGGGPFAPYAKTKKNVGSHRYRHLHARARRAMPCRYVSRLPQTAPGPLAWPVEAQLLLNGTDLGASLAPAETRGLTTALTNEHFFFGARAGRVAPCRWAPIVQAAGRGRARRAARSARPLARRGRSAARPAALGVRHVAEPSLPGD